MRFCQFALSLALFSMHAQTHALQDNNSTSYTPTPAAALGQVEGMVVYGKRPRAGTITKLHDDALDLETSRVLFVKEALETADRNPVQIDIEFAPRSASLTALGRERLDLIATSMRIVDDQLSFIVTPGNTTKNQLRSISKLEIARTKAIMFYINTQQQVSNSLSLPKGFEDKVRAKTPWSADSVNSLTITFTR